MNGDHSNGHSSGNVVRQAPDDAMRSEMAQILVNPPLSKAPQLSRLLEWLVVQTIAGRGDSIKAYEVAVDGLGKAEDFDTQQDSYPRVQVARLRASLEAYYAKNLPLNELCLYLQPGSYRVRMARLAKAYPELYRPVPDVDSAHPAVPPLQIAEPVRQNYASRQPFAAPAISRFAVSPQIYLIAGIAIAAILIVAIYLQWSNGSLLNKSAVSSSSPIVLMSPAEGGGNELTGSAYAVLADGLSRSWIARISLNQQPNASSNGALPIDYRIDTQFEAGATDTLMFLRLTDTHSQTLLWSKSATLVRGKALDEQMAPLIAELSGPFGIIAKNEMRRTNGEPEPGYSCLIGYLSFLETRDKAAQPKLARCLAEPSPEHQLEAIRLAMASFYAMEGSNIGENETTSEKRASDLAEQAIDLDPSKAYAQFAMARALFARGNCAGGVRHAKLAASANPYDPALLAVLGGMASNCGEPDGRKMLDKAYRYRVDGESFARLSLILGFIAEKDRARLTELSEPAAESDGNAAYYHLCETLIAASLDQPEKARAHWALFKRSSPQGLTDEAMVAQFIMAKPVRMTVVRFLTLKQVIANEP